ncbi:MAG: PEP-CTERM system histidine kinase PrsK, partial [Gammaproteobacteria bacterium]|nr:PEP-CTERM system histidine kinase PrsK [Gammaproteobacteria bacterium]
MAEYSFSALSHGIAALSFFLLAALLGKGYLRRNTDRTLFVATLVSIAWASSIATQALWSVPPFIFRYVLELVRDALWIMVLFALIKDSAHHGLVPHDIHRWLSALLLLVIGLLLGTGVAELTLNALILDGKPKLVGQIAVSLLGLVLLEQLWRNASLYGRSSVKYLCLGIGALFGYDFFLYSDALLFGQMSQPLWEARGAVNALIVPLLATTLINARKQPLELQLSRHVVFHAGTLFLAGAYLLIVAAGGYYVRAIGGTWGEA